MRKKIIMFWLVVLIFGLAGCSMQPEEKEPEIVRSESLEFDDDFLHIGLIQTGKESGWRDANSNDYQETFTKERGYDLIYIDGNSSPERQVKAMQDLIRQQVDYIIVQPIVEYGWDEAVEFAQEAGIPVIVAINIWHGQVLTFMKRAAKRFNGWKIILRKMTDRTRL